MVFQKLAEDGASVYWHFIANTMLPFLTCSPESRRLGNVVLALQQVDVYDI